MGKSFELHSLPPASNAPDQDSVLVPGRNCWRIERAHRLGFLVDASAYFTAVRAAMAAAQRSIFILGWDIDSRVRLVPEGANDGFPEPLGEFLDALVASRPDLKAHVLSWDFAVLFALEREWLTTYKMDWRTHRHLSFRLDDCHPFGASHHQKVVVIDDRVAFVGGLDLTRCRWDTPEHLADDPRRIDPDGKPFKPFHDVQAIVDGNVARALGELARERWWRATGKRIRPADLGDYIGAADPWPRGLVPDISEVNVGISRTEPRFERYSGVDEIRNLHMDAIASARRHLYLENQYFSSAAVGQALSNRLTEPHGPEVVVVTPKHESGWLEETTMGVLRARLYRQLHAADAHGRFAPYCPILPNTVDGCLNVHSKVMAVDDELLTIGSANLSNRSMGFDTECNLVLEARSNGADAPRVREAVARFRARLLGEHLDVTSETVQQRLAAEGSLIRAIESLRGPGRTLAVADPKISPEVDALVPDYTWIDPEQPIDPDKFVAEFVPRDVKPNVSRRALLVGIAAIVLTALAVAWRMTPLQQLADVEHVAMLGERLSHYPLAPALALLAYVIGGLLVMPVMVLIVVTGMVFGPLWGGALAIIGSCLSAATTYGIGHALGRDVVHRFAGKRINRLSQKLAKRGLIAVAIVRMLPIAPFSIVNVVAGASQIGFRDFMLGTLIGMTPGILMTVVFVDRITEAVRRPSGTTVGMLAIVAGLVFGTSLLIKRYVEGREAK